MKSSWNTGPKQGPPGQIGQSSSSSTSSKSAATANPRETFGQFGPSSNKPNKLGVSHTHTQTQPLTNGMGRKILPRVITDPVSKSSVNSPSGMRRGPKPIIPTTANVKEKDTVSIRKPWNGSNQNAISVPSFNASKGEKDSPFDRRRRLPGTVKTASTNTTTKPKVRVGISSPATIRKAASSLGVQALGVLNPSDSNNQRNVQVEEPQSRIGKGNFHSSRSVDSLSDNLGANNEEINLSPALTPRVENEIVLHQQIQKLQQELDLRDKEVERLREEKEFRVNKADIKAISEELDDLPTDSVKSFGSPSGICEVAHAHVIGYDETREWICFKKMSEELQKKFDDLQIKYNEKLLESVGSQHGNSDVAVPHAISYNETCEQICYRKVSDELQKKYEKLEIKYNEQLFENARLQNVCSQGNLDVKYWEDGYKNLKMITDQERKNMAEERIDWKSFQDDLLIAVRVANDFKTDAHEKLEALQLENLALRAKINSLDANSKDLNDIPVVPRRVCENPLPLQRESKSNKREGMIVIEEANVPDTIPLPKSNEDHASQVGTYDNNKENCVAIGYNNNLEPKSNQFSSKRVIGSVLNKSEMGNGSIDHDDDPLVSIVKATGSRRNALLRWCQSRTVGYKHVEITNFSTSWSNGMALCALLHSYLPDQIPYDTLKPENCEANFNVAFKAAESIDILTTLSLDEMVSNERPSWEKVMSYVKDVYMKLGSCD